MQTSNVTGVQTIVAPVQEASVEKAYGAEKHVSAVRLGIVIFNTVVYLLLLDTPQTIQWLAYTVIVVALGYSVYVHVFKPYRRFPVMLSSFFISITDALLITFWLCATGGFTSPFYLLWYAGIISIAFRYSLRETIISALIYSFSYLALLAELGQIGGNLTEIIVRIGYIFVIAAMSASFAQETLYQIRAKIQMRDLAQSLEREKKERKRAEDDLRASEERLRLIVEQTPAVLWTVNTDLQFTSSLGAGLQVLGFRSDKVIGTDLSDYFQSNNPEVPAIAVHHRALSGESVKRVIELNERVYQWYLEPLRVGSGQIIGAIGISFDITDSKHAEAHRLQLAIEQERVMLLEKFISNISHDLKTPLSVIYTNLYLLEHSGDPDKQPNRLETIKAQTQHLEKLIQDILTMSRIDKTSEIPFRAFDLNSLLETFCHSFVSRFEQKNLGITLDLDQSLPQMQGNEELLHTAFVYLLENAIIYTPHGGSITLKIYREGGETVAEVRDTGVGIDAADLSHIFEPFYRADEARGTDTGGTGLGLAIVQKIIEMHAGRTKVESMVGAGSQFKVIFPSSSTLTSSS